MSSAADFRVAPEDGGTRRPTPEDAVDGTLLRGGLLVGVGVVLAAAASYAFLVVSARILGPAEYGALAVLWSLVYIASGVFSPLEQEVSRALSARRGVNVGGAPVVRRAGVLGLGAVVCLAVIVVAGSWLGGDRVLRGDAWLVAGLVCALMGHAAARLFSGVLSGTGRFGRYGAYISLDASIRLALCVAFAMLGVTLSWPYGLALAIAPLLAILPARLGIASLTSPGPEAPWRELSVALWALLTGSVLAVTLLYAPSLLVEALTSDVSRDDAGIFNAGLILARVPVIVFSAVLVVLLPRLSQIVAAGHARDIPRAMARPLAAVGLALGIGTVAAFWLGSDVMTLVYGDAYATSSHTIGALTAGTSAYVVALTLSQGLIALEAATRAAWSWALGLVVLGLVAMVADVDVASRVTLAYLAGTTVGAVSMAWMLLVAVRARPRPGDPDGYSGRP